jgi:hypothetical protein
VILVAGFIIITLIVWAIRAGIRRARKKARARAEARKARAAALAAQSCRVEEHGDGRSSANFSAG